MTTGVDTFRIKVSAREIKRIVERIRDGRTWSKA